MGKRTAVDLLENLKFENAVKYHLTGNCYPPPPIAILPACLKAINYMKQEKFDNKVRLPDGMMMRNRKTGRWVKWVTARRLSEWLHLDVFWMYS